MWYLWFCCFRSRIGKAKIVLSKEEELRVAACIDIAKEDIKTRNADLAPESALWLAEKLREINNEAAKYSEELQKCNEEYARLREVFE